MGASNGFPGMLGSIDCIHWKWKIYITTLNGQFKGKGKYATTTQKIVASNDLWVWHSYFGLSGSNNDLNVLRRFHMFARLSGGETPPVNFKINGHQYNMGYYLVDGIYPAWSTCAKTISNPQSKKMWATKKHVERMSSEHLGFYKLALPLFVVLHDSGTKRICGASWPHAWSCITWS